MSLAFRPMIEALGYLRANALSYTGIPGLKFDYLERERVEQNVVNRGSQKVIQVPGLHCLKAGIRFGGRGAKFGMVIMKGMRIWRY